VVDGIYCAIFDSQNTDIGKGILVARKGKLHGGDSVCVYRGEYKPEEDSIWAEVIRYDKSKPTIFGKLDYYTFKLNRDHNEGTLSFSGPVEQHPDHIITIKLTWLGFLIG
jgi:hypothetical protein